MEPIASLFLDYLKCITHDPKNAVLDLQKLPEEFQEFGKSLVYFSECVMETNTLAKAIAKGNLNIELPPPSNEMAAPFKSLHASLKHLTWQTQQVAKGDYQQRVDFMGDFSDAFNVMIEQLEQRRLALLDQIQALRQSKSLYEMLAGQIQQQIIVTDLDTSKILFLSREMDGVMVGENSDTRLCQWLKEQTLAMKGKSELYVTELELQNHVTVQFYSVSIHPLHWNQHNALAFVFTDISTEKEQLKKLQNVANIDTLTQLYNRRYGMEVIEQWLSEDRNFVLCFLDIDNLKYVNDEHGHTEGDQYITCVSTIIREFSSDAVVCRIGGDEFMILAENWSPEAAAGRLELLRKQLTCSNSSYDRSVSYGLISVGPDNILKASDLLSVADEKMYEYKRAYKLLQRRKTLGYKSEKDI